MVQTGDEVLDYRQALEKFPNSPHIIVEGGSHGFQHFSDYIDHIFSFGQTASSSKV